MGTGTGDGFGPLLRRRRRAAGLTQDEPAERAGLSVRAVRDTERGASRPHRRTIGRLADALGLAGAGRDEFTRTAGGEPPAEAGEGGRAADSTAAPAQARPCQLPATAADFTGRPGELKTLTGLLDQGERPPGTVVITAIGGTAGVGRTALAHLEEAG
jgi:transcriptional regulator with XRE-family HTH domain